MIREGWYDVATMHETGVRFDDGRPVVVEVTRTCATTPGTWEFLVECVAREFGWRITLDDAVEYERIVVETRPREVLRRLVTGAQHDLLARAVARVDAAASRVSAAFPSPRTREQDDAVVELMKACGYLSVAAERKS